MKPDLGQIQPDGLPLTRDAIHAAIVLASTREPLKPGQRVRFTDDTLTEVIACQMASGSDIEYLDYEELPHGIVDPFITLVEIAPHSKVWVFLWPGSTPNMRHHYDITLKSIEQAVDDYAHEQWCDSYGCS